MKNNIEVIKDKEIAFISIQDLSEIMLTYGMSKQGFFRFCFQLLAGEVFQINETTFKIKEITEYNINVVGIIDQPFIENYSKN